MISSSKEETHVQPSKTDLATDPGERVFQVLDVQSVCAENPSAAVRKFVLRGKPKVVNCDVFIAGGGMGGVAAAIRAAQAGVSVCLSEETDWIGGQATAQGVSALDENYMVEETGATRLYQQLRQSIRDYYRTLPGVSPAAAGDATLNPGECWVSWLSFEPQVALSKLYDLIAQETRSNPPEIFLRYKAVDAKVVRGRVHSVLAVNLDTGSFVEFRPRFCIDATELGDLLPLTGVPYSSGAETRAETGEPHAPEEENAENVQDFVYPFVIEFRPGENHTIAKPAHYDEFLEGGKFTFAGYKMFESAPAPGRQYEFLPFWTYRRLIACQNFCNSGFKHDVSMINWESNDLRGKNIVDKQPQEQAQQLALAKDLSIGFLYWMQTEAPRDDGGKGYPELYLRTDVLGTGDGLSKYPYIREARRIRAEKTIVEQEIAAAYNSGARAKLFDDSVGIGLYPIDIHGHQDVPGAGQSSKPFQIPLSAMVQRTVRNLVPACKNIGTTHVTNGAYRLHPIEWAIGEAAGSLVGFCVKNHTLPFKVAMNALKTRSLQNILVQKGSPIFWFDDVRTDHKNFAAIQYVAESGIMPAAPDNLHFLPDQPVTREEAEQILSRALRRQPSESLMTKIYSADTNRADFAQKVYELVQPRKAR